MTFCKALTQNVASATLGQHILRMPFRRPLIYYQTYNNVIQNKNTTSVDPDQGRKVVFKKKIPLL